MRRVAVLLLIGLMQGFTAFAQGGYVTEKNIPYHQDAGDYAKEKCLLDFYYPTDIKDFPVIVWFHGGGLEAGSKEIPAALQEQGIGIIGVGYRFLDKATVQECIDDAAAAVAWAFREVASRGGDTTKIFVAGHSAGGYLTDMVVLDKSYLAKYGIDSERIAGAFPYSAQVITHFNVRKRAGVGELQPRLDETAPLYHVRKTSVPMLVLSGDRELELYGRYEEQAFFWRMMKLIGNDDIQLYEFDGFTHGTMPIPAHQVTLKFIKGICSGSIPAR